jgi:hypothetical protein
MWRQEGINALQSQLQALDSAQSADDTASCCDKLVTVINQLIKEREDLQAQCKKSPVTINVITDKASKVQAVASQCDPNTINVRVTAIDADPTKPSEPIKPKPTEQLVDNTPEKPAKEIEKPNLSTPKEYGYGFWIRFITLYPTRLENCLENTFYFIARLSKNNPSGNTDLGDR